MRGPAASARPAAPSGRAVPGTARRRAKRAARGGRPRARRLLTSPGRLRFGAGLRTRGRAGHAWGWDHGVPGYGVRDRARPPTRFPQVRSPAAERSGAPTTLVGRGPAGPGLLAGGRTGARPPGQELGRDPPARRAPSCQKGDPRAGPAPPRRELSQEYRSAGFRSSAPSQGLPGPWVLRIWRLPGHGFLVTSLGCMGPRRKLRTLVSSPRSEDTWSLCAPAPSPTLRALCRDPRGLRETRAKGMRGGVGNAGVCDAKATGSVCSCARACVHRGAQAWCFWQQVKGIFF